jgi:hypothetical protein
MPKDKIKKILNSIPDADKAEKKEPEFNIEDQSNLTNNDIKNLVKDQELEDKYGDSKVRTFIESGASAASFGLSDQVLAKFGGEEMKEALRERRQRNAEAAIAGEIAGVVAPTIASGGTSLLAKGTAAGVKTAAKAAAFTERVTAKQLAKIAQETGKKSLAKEIIKKSIPKTAGSAVEGSFYGAGQLVSEEALGTAEFNAENLAAYSGVGALIGGAAGGVLGTVEGLVPVIKNNQIVDFARKKLNTNIDKRMAGAKLSKMTTSEITKLKETSWGQQIYDNIPKYYKKNLNLKVTDDIEKLYQKSSKEVSRLGDEIGIVARDIDNIAKEVNPAIMPTNSKIASRIQTSLSELKTQFKKNPDLNAKKSIKKIDKRIKAWDEWLYDPKKISAKEIKELKTNLQQAAKWSKPFDQMPIDGKIDQTIAEAVRQEFLDLADKISIIQPGIGSKLRELNIDYGTGLTITNRLKRAVDKDANSDFIGLKDLLVADVLTETAVGGIGVATAAVAARKFLESDFRRKLTLLTNVEKANNFISNKITSGVSNFFSKTKKAAQRAGTKVLISTSFAVPDENGKLPKKAKDKKEAFKQITDSLTELIQNPESLTNHLSTNALRLTNAAPNTSVGIDSVITNAVSFLYDKLPKNPSPSSMFYSREFEPSSIELAKFERYLEAVENPMSVLDDLNNGTITREAVEAIKSVYPDIYSRIQETVIEKIAEKPDMNYEKRLQLGILFDIDADPSLIPQNITALQQTYADEQQQQTAAMKQTAGAVPTTQGGLDKISFAEDAKTQSEQVATRTKS